MRCRWPFMAGCRGVLTADGMLTRRRPASLKDKSVLIVGFSNSAADTATTLVGHAKHVYISRRHDSFVVCYRLPVFGKRPGSS